MARVQYGAIVTDLKGSIGGQVFQGGNVSKVLRNKGYRKGTSSELRQAACSRLVSQTMRWRSLTAAQRTSWAGVASSWAFLDKFGNTYYGSAYQVFTAYNLGLITIGLPVANVPLVPLTGEIVDFIAPDWDGSNTLVINWGTITTVEQTVQVFATSGVSPGRNIASGRYKMIGQEGSNAADQYLAGAAYTDAWGTPAVGSQVNIMLKVRINNWPRVFQTVYQSVIVL